MKAFSDSDFAADVDDQRSISGFIVYPNAYPILWRSKGQKVPHCLRMKQNMCLFLRLKLHLAFVALLGSQSQPIKVNVDNIGAMYLSQHAWTGNRTKHIDMIYHFVLEYIENRLLKARFLRSEDGRSDLFTKNMNLDTFKRLSPLVLYRLKD